MGNPLAHVRTPVRPPRSAQRELGLALYRLRLERGLSLRALARRMGYSAHSVFVDVEKGLRLPSESLVNAYEKSFDLPTGSLLGLRQRALVERADALTDALGRTLDPQAAPTPFPGTDWSERVGQLASVVVRLPSAAIDLFRTWRVPGAHVPGGPARHVPGKPAGHVPGGQAVSGDGEPG